MIQKIRVVLKYVKQSGGFLTSEGRYWSPKEWHSMALGILAGWRDEVLGDAWDRDTERMHHELEWQYYKKGHFLGKRIPYTSTYYVLGWISGFVKAWIVINYLL